MLSPRHALLGLLLASATVSTGAQTALDVPVHVRRLSDRAIVVSLGDFVLANQTIALASRKGLVVVDTQASRSAGRLVRAAIEKAFGRTDFAYVISTHQHADHTNGNAVYPGVPIVGHRECAAGMRQDLVGAAESVERMRRARLGFENDLKALDPQSDKARTNREYIALLGATVQEADEGLAPAYPTITFTDRMTIDLGDMTVQLYSLPAGHTRGDIAVHVPEERLLSVGDMIAEGWLPVLDARAMPDPDDFLPKWRILLADAKGTAHVVMGHGFSTVSEGEGFSSITYDTLAWRYTYLQALWDGLVRAKADKRTLEEAKAQLSIDSRFPELKGKRREVKGRDGAAADSHLQNIETMWRALDSPR